MLKVRLLLPGLCRYCETFTGRCVMSDEIRMQFEKMGARVKVGTSWSQPLSIDVHRDRQGEYFTVRRGENVEVRVSDATPWNRHLLLRARIPNLVDDGELVSTFLCGHDESHWFVAAI